MPFTKGHKHSEGTKRKIGDANRGRHRSIEWKRKIGEANKGAKNYLWGKHLSEETKRKMSEARSGEKNPLWGKHLSKETKRKISETQKRIGNIPPHPKGENHPFWKGGISFEPYTTDWTRTLRISIRERDNYTCQLCGKKQGDRAFSVHHIDYNKVNCNPDNLITLCGSCHSKTNQDREHWVNIFGKQ